MIKESEFKVMPWLRSIRDDNADTESGISVRQRIKRTRKESGTLLNNYLQSHPSAKYVKDDSPSLVEVR